MTPGCRVILVTGASSGIGRACAVLLASQGHRVFGTYRRAPSDSNLSDPNENDEAGFEPIRMDVTSDDSVEAGVAEVMEAAGHVDVVINNAGYGLAGSIEDTSIEEAKRQFDTNFFGVLRVSQAVLPSMRARQSGRIINISSLGGLIGLPFQGLYAASKFAVEGMTESLRHEVAPFGVQVTLVEPGDIRTRVTDNRVFTQAASSESDYASAFNRALAIIERDERGGQGPEQVAKLVAKLVTKRNPAPRYTAGQLAQRSSVWAKRVLPAPMFERIIRSYYGL